MVDAVKFKTFYLNENTADVHFLFKSNGAELIDEAESDTQKKSTQDVKSDEENDETEDAKCNADGLIEDQKSATDKQSCSADNTTKTAMVKRIPAHKLMLATSSSVFREMFFDGPNEVATVEITEVSSGAFKEFLPMIVSNASAILTSDTFLGCSRAVLTNIVTLKTLPAQQKFKACMEWSRNICLLDTNKDPNDMRARRSAIGDCFKLINFIQMRPMELLGCIDRYSGLFESAEINDLFKAILRKCNY